MARGGDIMGGLSDELERLAISENWISLSSEVEDAIGWTRLPIEVQDAILAHITTDQLPQTRLVCKGFRDVTVRGTFHQARARLRPTECSLGPLVFYAENGSWHVRGFDWKTRIWSKLPSFRSPVSAPDRDLFRDYHVAGDKGLICVNVGKAHEAEKLYVCNPLTGETFKLPSLEFPRHPVILNVRVTLARKGNTFSSSYRVIAAGSAASGTESLSRKTEVFDSGLGKWEAAGDVPGADFSLNEYHVAIGTESLSRKSEVFDSDSVSGDWEVADYVPGADFSLNDYQTGVYCESQNLLLCVGSMVDGSKGILGFDVVKRKWREDWIFPLYQLHPLTDTASTVHFHIAQLVECSGMTYLFSEQEAGRKVTLCIDRLDLDTGSERFAWSRMVTRPRQGNRALLVYPEYTCVPVGENKLCIFNTIKQTGWTYEFLDDFVRAGRPLPLPVMDNGIMFHSLNPVGYAFEPSFWVSPFPRPAVKEEEVCAQGSGTEL